MTKCDGCIFDNTCVDCNDFDCGELEALLKEHDKQIRADAIETVYNTLIDSVPIIENRDIIYGFSCAIQRVEQLKEQANG